MEDHSSVWREGPVRPWRYYHGELPQDQWGPHGWEGMVKRVFAGGSGNVMQTE